MRRGRRTGHLAPSLLNSAASPLLAHPHPHPRFACCAGKYSKDNKPSGPRAQLFTEARYKDVQVGEPGGGRALHVLMWLCSACGRCAALAGGALPGGLLASALQPSMSHQPLPAFLPPALSVPACLPRAAPQVLLDCMRAVAEDQGGKTLGQVAINWTM